jgi:N,N'-diacetylchitobiose transport system permease protein
MTAPGAVTRRPPIVSSLTGTAMAGTRGSRYRTMTWVWRVVAIVFALVTVFPVYWMIQSAFEPGGDLTSLNPSFFPLHFTFHNFVSAVNHSAASGGAAGSSGVPYFWDDARNSLMVVAAATLITLVFAFFAAAAISRFRLRGATAFLVLILVVQMVPGTALIIPLYLMLDNLHLINSYFGLILVYAGATLPFTIWVLRGFVMGVPIELEEAAQVDGASRFGAFWRILLPLVLPGLISSGIFAFITAWNDFLVANLIMQTNSHQTLPVWLFSFETNVGIDYGGLMAGCTIMAVPVVIFFLFAQRRIVSGMTAGAVKM